MAKYIDWEHYKSQARNVDSDECVGCFIVATTLVPMLLFLAVMLISAAILTAVGCYKLVAMMLS